MNEKGISLISEWSSFVNNVDYNLIEKCLKLAQILEYPDLDISMEIEKIKEILSMWTLRKMTIRGKIQIINTMIITQMLYPGNVLHIPKTCIKEYNNIITQFIWDNKPPKIKYTTLINTIENGGLNLQDLTSKLEQINNRGDFNA